jgi:tetratricopeptide (TPR) repeat protein
MASFRAGSESEALEALTRAIEVQDDFFGAYYLRGAIHRSLGQDAEAESDYLKVLEIRPESDEARSALIELHLDNEDSVKAMKIVQDEIDRQPQQATSYLLLADVHRLRRQHDEAIAAVGLALEQDPNLPQAYLRLGELWLEESIRRGDHVALEKAVQALGSAAEMDPANGQAALALGRACLAIEDEERGFSELQRASEATPIQAEAHRLLGDIYQNRGNYAEAVTAYHIYLKLVGETPSVLERMGDAYSGMEKFETAATTYLQVAALEPRRVLPYVKAARAWLAAGQLREAERACRRGLSSSPENQILADLLVQATEPDAEAGPT